jgi:hypothetical protein
MDRDVTRADEAELHSAATDFQHDKLDRLVDADPLSYFAGQN